MKPLSRLLVSITILLLIPSRVAASANDGWVAIAPGMEYQKFTLPDPNNVFVTRMDRNNPGVTIESSIGQGRLSGGPEAVSDMAQRYDQAINYWGGAWGARNRVVVAINGFYFGPPEESDGVPWSGQVHSGWYAKRFWELESGSGFAWKLDRTAFIGECITHPADKQVVYYFHNGELIGSQPFDGINVPRDRDQFILYTPQYDASTLTDGSDAVEVLVELSRPTLIALTSDMTRGRIVEIRKGLGNTPIPFDHAVLSMQGAARAKFQGYGVEEGDEIGIAQRIKNCNGADSPDWSNTYASVGGAFYFLKDGVIQDFSDDPQANVRDPRTAVAFNDNYIFFIVVDGRDSRQSAGMRIPELAEFAKNTLGASWGIAQDGGGSSTMVVNGQVVNNTYCNIVDCDRHAGEPAEKLLADLAGKFPALRTPDGGRQLPVEPDQPPQLDADGFPLTEEYYAYRADAAGTTLQRLVANGLMMVVVEPKEQSSAFRPADKVYTKDLTQVRLGPGVNYRLLALIDPGNQVNVLDHDLNGLKAKGSYWWKILFDVGGQGIVGWATEETLTIPWLEFLPAVLR